MRNRLKRNGVEAAGAPMNECRLIHINHLRNELCV